MGVLESMERSGDDVVCGWGLLVTRLLIAVDRAAGVDPADVVAAWDGDDEARGAGLAAVEVPRLGEFLGDVLALVVNPLAVNLAGSAATALVSRLMQKLRPAAPNAGDLEVVASAGRAGDLVVVMRVAGARQ
jgi:hypothetical protein